MVKTNCSICNTGLHVISCYHVLKIKFFEGAFYFNKVFTLKKSLYFLKDCLVSLKTISFNITACLQDFCFIQAFTQSSADLSAMAISWHWLFTWSLSILLKKVSSKLCLLKQSWYYTISHQTIKMVHVEKSGHTEVDNTVPHILGYYFRIYWHYWHTCRSQINMPRDWYLHQWWRQWYTES